MMLGLSRTVVSDEAVGFEFLRIVANDDGVFYLAQPNGRPPTRFELVEQSHRYVRFENPEHDHPKVIHYRLTEEGTLVATIAGDEGEQELVFERVAAP